MNQSYLEYQVPSSLRGIFRKQAEQNINAEGWGKQGRNVQAKIDNFVHCWTTEEAFKQILIQRNIWFRYRGLYFGDAQGAGVDFTVKVAGKEVTIGLRSISADSLEKWKSVAYPNDRFEQEREHIADYHIACYHNEGNVHFLGLISKEDLLAELSHARVQYSPRNQENFRVVPLACFNDMIPTLEKLDKQ